VLLTVPVVNRTSFAVRVLSNSGHLLKVNKVDLKVFKWSLISKCTDFMRGEKKHDNAGEKSLRSQWWAWFSRWAAKQRDTNLGPDRMGISWSVNQKRVHCIQNEFTLRIYPV